MNKFLLAIYLFSLAGLVTSKCDCCDECGDNNQQEEEVIQPEGSCPALKKINSGFQGRGHATRYWDCCKPSCSWSENAGHGNECRECDANQNIIYNHSTKSVCDGGSSSTCLSQIPFTIKGCDNMGFAFAAVPGGSPGFCGRCFLLKFDGNGKYETKLNHQKLLGKQLVVMASNIGYDVSGGQFDVMIPGGGVGIFNGCANILGYNNGAQYGGFLTDCENSIGYSGSDQDIYNKRKECLKNKCETIFKGKATAKAGCVFLADFMEAAGNPTLDYEEVECPQVLKDRY